MDSHLLEKGTKQFKNVIWEGRFQPIHKGHLAYMNKLLAYGEHLYIVVVANEMSSEVYENPDDLPVRFFSEEVDPHHRPEKNIFPYHLRYRMVIEAVNEYFGKDAPITVMSGRRLDLAWDLYKKILPEERVFITPTRDSFEDVKAKAWLTLNEKNYRVDVSDLPVLSATMVRDSLKEKDVQRLSEFMMPCTVEFLKSNKYI
ncbi:adenylyltransferase/cytidyltransferase family protein [Flavobacterium columnare]|uniref:adenylyltransferase/cytidyltransferase family protein n=1 Tax=Flavobacterium columnare TaxID=996 RepID=UPI0040349EBF